jgi:hypothetical protein
MTSHADWQRYVILTHDWPFLHWDLMLEQSSLGLRTWRLLGSPDRLLSEISSPTRPVEIELEALPDHRTAYLDYEGPVSNGRGTVTRWDSGIYRILSEIEATIQMQFRGERISGLVKIDRPAPNLSLTFSTNPL